MFLLKNKKIIFIYSLDLSGGLYIWAIFFYFRLQDEYNRLEEEIKRTIEESKIVQDKYKTMYEDSRKEVAERHAQVEELRNKVR